MDDKTLTALVGAVREADREFKNGGLRGSTRQYVREWLLPALDAAGLEVVEKGRVDELEKLIADVLDAEWESHIFWFGVGSEDGWVPRAERALRLDEPPF